ncbi:unnamed protein product [Nezara viridula]|uniref:Tf2-1-like SH3-like domain-containing protein n=1 Tax=Nezara viridula TaxID=85310 RepID=A0A9P0H8Z2_NEZVI|nr:unnamed protein product [Nezara viridula]
MAEITGRYQPQTNEQATAQPNVDTAAILAALTSFKLEVRSEFQDQRKERETLNNKIDKKKAYVIDTTDKFPVLKPVEMVVIKALNYSVKEKKLAAKLMARFQGPYQIKHKLGASVYLLTAKNEPDVVRGIFHAALLKKYYVQEDQANALPIDPG